ncbi:hypothetical protein ACJ73_09773 [Blastomyces percursus]|uniref:Uncharacterized protein n=1 Tax=Blastomyces percursus TaxID=1658174 RepID=A0A1J9Q2K1_9EURO|nr:hypothetical protein ACJ73_09773 [Blastomyces percursus]
MLQASNNKLHEDNRKLQAVYEVVNEIVVCLERKISILESSTHSCPQREPATDPRTDQKQDNQTYASAAAATINAPTPIAASTGHRRPIPARYSKPAKLPRLFARLPTDHIARKASPIATLQRLRTELPEPASSMIKTVQKIPTGVAISALNMQGLESLLSLKDEISAILTNAQIEREEQWVTCIIPDLTTSYSDYTGETHTFSVEQVTKEFELQTKVKPMQWRWARKQPDKDTTALILSFSPDMMVNLPARITLFGWNRPIIRKTPKVQIKQCGKCWAFHTERYCTRKPRGRRCSSKEHQEGHITFHKEENTTCGCPNRCTNCLDPHAADDLSCPIRPTVKHGIIQRHQKSQQKAIRKTQNTAYWMKTKDMPCEGRYTILDGKQTGSPKQATGTSMTPKTTASTIHTMAPNTAATTSIISPFSQLHNDAEC